MQIIIVGESQLLRSSYHPSAALLVEWNAWQYSCASVFVFSLRWSPSWSANSAVTGTLRGSCFTEESKNYILFFFFFFPLWSLSRQSPFIVTLERPWMTAEWTHGVADLWCTRISFPSYEMNKRLLIRSFVFFQKQAKEAEITQDNCDPAMYKDYKTSRATSKRPRCVFDLRVSSAWNLELFYGQRGCRVDRVSMLR